MASMDWPTRLNVRTGRAGLGTSPSWRNWLLMAGPPWKQCSRAGGPLGGAPGQSTLEVFLVTSKGEASRPARRGCSGTG